MFKVNNKDTITTSLTAVFLLLTLGIYLFAGVAFSSEIVHAYLMDSITISQNQNYLQYLQHEYLYLAILVIFKENFHFSSCFCHVLVSICSLLLFFNKNVFLKYLHSSETSLPMKPAQSAFTCLKVTIETLEQGVKYVQN